MNDNRMSHDDARNFAPLIGFALGAAVGAGIALMLAPASGEVTRRRIGSAARRMGRDAGHTLDDARDTVMEAASGVRGGLKSALEAGRAALGHDGTPVELHPVSRIATELNPPARTL